VYAILNDVATMGLSEGLDKNDHFYRAG